MSLPQTLPPKLSVNGQLAELERRGQLDSKMQFGKSQTNLNAAVGAKAGVPGSPSRDRLIYISACLIGLHVEVTVRNGSSYSGIFHSTNTEKDFGIILKMARIVSDGSHREQKHTPSTATRPQTIIIPSRELVQIIAKDVPLTEEEFSNGHLHEKRQDLMIDSAISLSHFVEERELERWTPDNNDPLCPELEDIFDGSRNRKWDQFETNEVLFGVKSTFDEELYTTKLERGPQTRELEREALRIAREIEGEETDDLHLAEERGIDFSEDYEVDEETRFSAVYRGGPDDHHENVQLGFQSEGSSGIIFDASAKKQRSDTSERKRCNAGPLQMNAPSSQISSEALANNSSSLDRDNQLVSVGVHGHLSTEENRFLGTNITTLEKKSNFDDHKNNVVLNGTLGPTGIGTSSAVPLKSYDHQEDFPLDAAVCSSTEESKDLLTESLTPVGHLISAQPPHSSSRPSSSRSSSSDHVGGSPASSGPGLSPSSSMGSLASEKSKLNPYAKEFKLNPNAKSFTPTSSLRPHSPVSEGSFYYPANVSAVPHMPGLPVGVAIAPPYGMNQPVVYNPHAVQIQTPPAYVHPGGPYGQQMYFTQPRSVVYMPTYPPEMPYKGRDY